jgi:hypothetical protein
MSVVRLSYTRVLCQYKLQKLSLSRMRRSVVGLLRNGSEFSSRVQTTSCPRRRAPSLFAIRCEIRWVPACAGMTETNHSRFKSGPILSCWKGEEPDLSHRAGFPFPSPPACQTNQFAGQWPDLRLMKLNPCASNLHTLNCKHGLDVFHAKALLSCLPPVCSALFLRTSDD